MGKNLTQQARGKGGPSFTAPSFRYCGEAKIKYGVSSAQVLDIIKDQGHVAPLVWDSTHEAYHALVSAVEKQRSRSIFDTS